MPYGTIKVDTITFTAGGADTSVSISGLVQNPTFTGNITTTGTVTAATVVGTTTVSGATVTGTQAQFTVITGSTAGFTTITGTTVTGTTANFATVSGTTITGTTGNFGGTVTAATIRGTTTVSGATVTGNAGSFTTVTGGVATITSGVFATGAEALPSISFSSDPNTGIYSPGADQVAISTNGTGRLFVDSSGRLGVGTSSPGKTVDVSGEIRSTGRIQGQSDLLVSDWVYIGSSAGARGVTSDAGTRSLLFGINGSEVARLDTSGRLGLGTTGSVNSSVALLAIRQTGGTLSSTTVTRANAQGIYVADSTSPTNNVGNGIWFDSGTLLAGIASTRASTSNWGTDLRFYTHPTSVTNQDETYERVRIDPAGNVGIGTPSPTELLSIGFADSSSGKLEFRTSSYAKVAMIEGSHDSGTANGSLRFWTRNAGTEFERARIDSSGRLLVGTSNFRVIEPYGLGTDGQNANTFESVGDTNPGPGLALCSNSTTARMGPYLYFCRSGAATVGSNTVVTNGDNLGTISFAGADGTDVRTRGAAIYCEVDGTPGANDMPGRLVFSTTADGASSPTERMRIPNGGGVSIGSSVSPNALTQASGIRLGGSTIASYDFINVTTTPVTIANGVGIGGMGFVQAYNTSNGAQYTGIIMWRSGVVAVVSESNALGFALTYSVSGSTLRLQTASGTVTGSIITLAS